MDFSDSASEAAFRKEAREFLETNIHAAPGDLSESAGEWEQALAARKRWQQVLFDNGFAAITWPTAHGGRGLGPVEQIIWNQECNRVRAPSSVNIVGIGMAGPALIEHGSDDQRDRYLSKILSGEEIWCQLFSEPDAGSDLAAVATKAERVGDEWVVSGQKVWSSGAHFSRRAILLARTDTSVPKHKGMTFFALDMQSPGVTVRPLRQMNGEAHFNEVFLDGVRIPDSERLGVPGEGWKVATTTILHERMALGGSLGVFHMEDLLDLAREHDPLEPHVRGLVAQAFTYWQCLEFLNARIMSKLAAGEIPTAEGAITKLAVTRMLDAASEAALAILGPDAVAQSGPWQDPFLITQGIRIGGGTDDIQKNMAAERILGLPREPDPSREVAFSELRR